MSIKIPRPPKATSNSTDSVPPSSSAALDFDPNTLAAITRLADQKPQVAAQAERLNDCIVRFEKWIASLPGRVETKTTLEAPNLTTFGGPRITLRVFRDGQEWVVNFTVTTISGSQIKPWTRLRESSLELKLFVVPKLHKLIEEMAVQQERLKERIAKAADSFEEFAALVNMNKEGK